MNRLCLELRGAGRSTCQRYSARQIKIDQLATLRTDGMIVTISPAIKTAAPTPKLNLVTHPFVVKNPERFETRGKAIPGLFRAPPIKASGGGGMMFPRLHRLEHNLTLAGQR